MLRMLFSIGWLLILLFIFILYPQIPQKTVSIFLYENFIFCFFLILLITLILTFSLSQPSLKKNIDKICALKEIKLSEKTASKVKDLKTILENGEELEQ